MARILLTLLAVVAVVMLALLVLHVLFLGFWIVLLCAVVFGVFRLGRWGGRRSRQ
jgi:hypothetical protein